MTYFVGFGFRFGLQPGAQGLFRLCAQGALLLVFGGPCGMLEIEPSLAISRAGALPVVLSL